MRIILLAFVFLAPALPVQERDSAWTDLGFALAGTLGEPTLTGDGPLTPDSLVSVSLTGALPDAPTFLLWGHEALFAPLQGGTLVPWPQVFVLTTDADGNISLSGRMPGPGAVLPGTDVFVQFWIADPGAPDGFAASNAIRGLVP